MSLGGGGGTQMNKFEQVSSDHQKMSLAEEGDPPGLMASGEYTLFLHKLNFNG